MIIFPAIDLCEGQAVRLYKGDFAKKTVYSDDPVRTALEMAEKGAQWLHAVDLDGARTGCASNFDIICRIKKESGLKVETGGGIRSLKTIEKYLNAGIDRVILGTAAAENPGFLQDAAAAFKEKIAAGADLKDGMIAVKGWTENSSVSAEQFFERLAAAGVKTVICTDISKDGAMKGASLDLYKDLSSRFGTDIIASGGVSSLDDIKALKEMKLYGAIIGKAYYTGAIDLKKALEAAE